MSQPTGHHSSPSAGRQRPWTLGRLVEWSTGYLSDRNVDPPRLATELLLAHAMGCKKIDLYTRFEEVPRPAQMDTFRDLLLRAGRAEPVAYLIGRKEFYSLDFEVTPDVLIPRPETELLVDQVLEYCAGRQQQCLHILDLGTGSGCIGLALCRHLQQACVLGSDVSQAALDVATRNARRLQLGERFNVARAAGLDLPAEVVPPSGFDVLVSNPPYVADSDTAVLEPAVRKYEPHAALFAGPDGLAFYGLIAADCGRILAGNASVFVEIGYDQHDRVVDLMTAGGLRHVASWRDYNEGHWRVARFDRDGSGPPG